MNMQNSIFIFFLLFGMLNMSAQDTDESPTKEEKTVETNNKVMRLDNAVVAAIGSAFASGDFAGGDPLLGSNFQIGYKKALNSDLNLSFTFNKYNIVFEDTYKEGFMSFDLDLEYMFLPEKVFTPYIYGGPGFNATNGIENSALKFQLGVGMEYLVSEGVGLKLYIDRNIISNAILGEWDGTVKDSFYKIGIGANFYFSRGTKKVEDDGPTFIKKNTLDDF